MNGDLPFPQWTGDEAITHWTSAEQEYTWLRKRIAQLHAERASLGQLEARINLLEAESQKWASLFAQNTAHVLADNEKLKQTLQRIRDHYLVHQERCCLTCDQIAQDGLQHA